MVKSKKFGINAIIHLYSIKLLMNGAKLPFVITTIIVASFLIFGEVNKDVIVIVTDLILTIIPSLLGFVLSGYALLIGFGNIEVIAKKPPLKSGEPDNKPTLYQKVSTVFAVGLIMQIFLLVFTFSLKLIIKIDFHCFLHDFWICHLLNYTLFAMLIFGLLYVTVMIKDLVLTIFNFSQVQHLFINSPKQNDDEMSKN